MVYGLAAAILLPVLIQGGFYPTAFLIPGAALAGAGALRKGRALERGERALWALALLYLLASLARGYNASSLAQACLPACCGAFLYLYLSLSQREKGRLLDWVALASGLFAGLAILAFCGVVPLTGAVSARRLQFTFQYANAAGSWFAAAALLAQDREEVRVRRAALPCVTALLLTRSMGALALYGILQLVRLWRRRALWGELVLTHAAAVPLAGAFFLGRGWLCLLGLALLYGLSWYQDRLIPAALGWKLHWLGLAVGGAGAAVIAASRWRGALTFVERLVQIIDGLGAVARNPLLGVGAGNWSRYCPLFQSAQYSSTLIHSGPVQMGVDAGVLAAALAAAVLVLGWKRGGRSRAESLACLLLAGHSLLDFTLQFLPIDLLLLALLFAGEGQEKRSRRLAPRVALLGAAVLCAGMLYGQMQYKGLVYACRAGDWEDASARYERGPFGASGEARELYLQACYGLGRLDRILEETGPLEPLSTQELLYRAQALWGLGREDEACRLLLSRLGEQLYNVALFTETKSFFTSWDVSPEYRAEYDRLAAQANKSWTALGTLKGDQAEIGPMGEG